MEYHISLCTFVLYKKQLDGKVFYIISGNEVRLKLAYPHNQTKTLLCLLTEKEDFEDLRGRENGIYMSLTFGNGLN